MALPDFYAAESGRIRKSFEASGDGPAALAERSELVDRLVREIYQTTIPVQPEMHDNLCLVALC